MDKAGTDRAVSQRLPDADFGPSAKNSPVYERKKFLVRHSKSASNSI
jgi:hypothetical protein